MRLALGALSGALAVALCTVLVDKYVLSAEWWQVRHTVTSEPVAPQSDVGPPPGPLAMSWGRTTQVHRGPVAGYDSVAYDVAQGQVVIASGRGLEVRDARTGADRWSYRRSGWTMLGWASTKSRLIGYFERDGRRDDRLLVAFDALSGALLWRREGERPAAAARTTLRFPAGAGVVITTDGERRTLTGRSAVTGARAWRLRLPGGCRLFEGAAHPADARETLSALALDCSGRDHRSRLLAVDPATGRIRWDRPLGSGESPEVSMLDGVTLVSDGTALRTFDQDGIQTGVWNGDGVCGDGMCPAVLASGRLIVVHDPEEARKGTARMEAMDTSNGKIAWRRDVPDYTALAQAGGQVYALRPRLAEPLLPAGVDIVSPADGSSTTTPAPFSVDPDLGGVRPWLAAAGGLLYVAVAQAAPRPSGAARLVALRGGLQGLGPAELGGVVETDWPDACGLLTKPDLASVRLPDFVARPTRVSVGPVRLPRAVSCTYETPQRRGKPAKQGESKMSGADPGRNRKDGGKPSRSPKAARSEEPEPLVQGLTVNVRWVAESGSEASRMLDALQSTQAQARRRTDLGGDEAYELGPTAGTIALRSGRLIIVVDANRPPGVAARLARVVTYRLQHPS